MTEKIKTYDHDGTRVTLPESDTLVDELVAALEAVLPSALSGLARSAQPAKAKAIYDNARAILAKAKGEEVT